MKCKNTSSGVGVAGVPNDVGIGHSVNIKRSLDGQNQKISGLQCLFSLTLHNVLIYWRMDFKRSIFLANLKQRKQKISHIAHPPIRSLLFVLF